MFGQHKRSVSTNCPSVAPAASWLGLSSPGDLCWKYSVSDPSTLNFSLSRGLSVSLFSGFG